ncbi:alcohol dehydrogenase catalytic domain-containing protein [Nonomuraea rhodomycinica]|uniref:Alcohol dehydrogenase n=1 Tax=Nonomuraea rhodomycinica TaxID=1712872 RepID=A0A7Y6IX16_9ACTN|nr:zinc-binding dehydrogenase [Nonomuraea rhodomycinica]NUW45971.1 alcohol dehydrogenase [Nonomuraea rhodomycinica]
MRALTVSGGTFPAAPVTVPDPEPGPGEALVEIHHASVNPAEVRHLGHFPDGAILGYDAAGAVVEAAADGTGPAAGARVVAFGAGTWAERAAFPVDALAVVPDGVHLAEAAALPMAGIAAVRALRAAGPLLGSRVLVTGATGAVGRLAVQLARRAGAHVVAHVRDTTRAGDLGVETVTDLGRVEPVDAVVEVLGGPYLVAAWRLLRPGGSLQSIGWAAGEPAVFEPNSTFMPGAARTLSSVGDPSTPGPDLGFLVDLLARGELSAGVGGRWSWERPGEPVAAILAGKVHGKAVIDIKPTKTDGAVKNPL